MAAPPLLWQHEVGQQANLAGPGSADAQRAAVFNVSEEKISNTWAHVKRVTQEGVKEYDLLDLLINTSREDVYTTSTPGWPSLLRPVSPTMWELPALVQDKYRTCQTMCFCGVFPPLRRAWASIDNSLFLWRYDRSDDVPVEYCGEEQAISCVGLVTPKPGVFLEAVQHLLIVATTTEVVLLGVCVGPGGSSSDPQAELTLQPLPLYSIPSDNVVLTCCASTPGGRIFLGGADGHVYELHYSAKDTWRQRRCYKTRITSSLTQLLPSFLPSFIVGGNQPLEKLVVDTERNVMYSVAANSMLQVFDLGPKGTDPCKKVAEVDFMEAASRATYSGGAQQVFRPGGDKQAAAVKYIAPIPSRESTRLHLVAVTGDGRRCYFSYNTFVPRYYNPTSMGNLAQHDPTAVRPQGLVAVIARQAAYTTTTASSRNPMDVGSSTGRVMVAMYDQGVLLLGEATGPEGKASKLVGLTRAHTLPPASTQTTSGRAPGLRELVGELGQTLPGETVALAALVTGCTLGPDVAPKLKEELLMQMFYEPQRFVLVSTAGVLEVERRRPLDILAGLLAERSHDKLLAFFKEYGPAEAAAMCYSLVTAGPLNIPAVVAEEALAALDNPALVGEPMLPEEGQGGEAQAANAGNGIFMGIPVDPNPEPVWSGAHAGLCVFISRLLAPVWEVRCITSPSNNRDLLRCNLSEQTLKSLEASLHALVSFLDTFAARRKSRGFSRAAGGPQSTLVSRAGAAARGGFGSGTGGLFGGPLGAGALVGPYGGSSLEEVTGRAMNVMTVSGPDGVVELPHGKRQRLWNAFVIEEQRNAAVRALASKAAQAMLLLRTLSYQNITRLATRLDHVTRGQLRDLTLRDLVFDGQGQQLATALIGALVGEALDVGGTGQPSRGGPGGVEELAALLQSGAPDYFREQDKVFYQGVAQLSAAEAAVGPGERQALARDALAHLLKVPQCCDLNTLVPRLATLRQWEGTVELCLRAASIADPNHAAWRDTPSDPATFAAREARSRCYQPMLQLLLSLMGYGSAPPPRLFPSAPPPAAAAGGASAAAGAPQPEEMSAADLQAAQQAMLRACARSSDQYLHHCLYRTLMEVPGGAGAAALLGLDPPHLESYLRQEGGLGLLAPGGAAPPLNKRQVEHLQLLCRLHVQKERYSAAAQVYRVLAERRSGSGQLAVSLEERCEDMHNALLQGRSVGDDALLEGLKASCRLLELQLATAQQLERLIQKGGGAEKMAGLETALAEIRSSCLPVSDLYNTYTQPHEMWDLCLEICDFAGNVPVEYVRQLWDLLLKQAAETSAEPVVEGGSRRTAALEACIAVVTELGSKFYPNEASLPLAHLTLRLEQMAAGLWPEPGQEPLQDPSLVVRCLRRVCSSGGGAASGIVAGVYESLLSRRAAAGLGELQIAGAAAAGAGGVARGPLRLQLLRSLAAHCELVLREELDGTLINQSDHGYPSRFLGRSRQAAALADLAERCAAEARGEGPEGVALATQFESLQRQLAADKAAAGGW